MTAQPLTMVFSKIRGITLRDFSSVGHANKEDSESEEENPQDMNEDASDVITDNLGDIGR